MQNSGAFFFSFENGANYKTDTFFKKRAKYGQ